MTGWPMIGQWIYLWSFIGLVDEDLAHIAPVAGKVGRPQEIKAFRRLWIEVQPDLAGPRQGDGLLLNDLPGCIDQFQQVTSCLVAVELEQQAVGGRVGKGLITDIAGAAGTAGRIKDDDIRVAYFPACIRLFDPEIEFAHISLIKVVLILVF